MDSHKTIQSIFHVLGILVILGFLALQGGSCMLLMSAMSDSGGSSGATPGLSNAGTNTVTLGGDTAEATFLRIPVFGVISADADENYFGLTTHLPLPDMVDELLAYAYDSPQVDGILVDIDSPGGAVDPSDVIFHKLRQFSAETGKPVVAQMNGMAASGGFYIAMGAERVLAHPSCLTGSIGVIIQTWNAAGLMEKAGLELVTLTSGPNKDLLNPGRKMRPEEREIIMSVVNDAYDSFVDAVVAGRDLDEVTVRELADGRIYTARQALELDLIDAIGYDDDLLAMMCEVAEVGSVNVIDRSLASPLWESLGLNIQSAISNSMPGSTVDKILERYSLEPGLYYLWAPGF
ncbi:MAG: signal peptide peptidase SppA [bacterium]|nr:signal peptide peptidase SppA [bacterium]